MNKRDACNFIDSLIFGSLFQLRKANRIIKKKMEQAKYTDYKNHSGLAHTTDILNTELDRTIKRLERIEDKATNAIIGIAIAIPIFSGFIGLLEPNSILASSSSYLRTLAILFAGFTMGQLVLSGYLAIKAYKIGQVFLLTLEDHEPIADKNKHLLVLLYCIHQNRNMAIIRSNRLSTSFNCLRNGLATMFTIFILLLVIA